MYGLIPLSNYCILIRASDFDQIVTKQIHFIAISCYKIIFIINIFLLCVSLCNQLQVILLVIGLHASSIYV